MPDLTDRARQLRQSQTDAEKKLWSKLRNRQFMNLKFRRQQQIESFIADFICFERRLIIELDGGQHADSQYDRQRTEFIEGKSFLVKRYWNNEVLGNLDGILTDIEQTVNTLTPALSLQGEGEVLR